MWFILSELYEALKKLHKKGRYLSAYYYEKYEVLDLTNYQDLYNAIEQVPRLDLGKITIDNDYYGKTYYVKNIKSRKISQPTFESEYNKNNKKNILIINDFFIMLKLVRNDFDENGQDLIDAILESKPVRITEDTKHGFVVIYQINDWCTRIEKYIKFLIKEAAATNRPDKNQLKF